MHVLATEEKTYATYDELFTSVKSFGHTQEYTITTKTSSGKGRKNLLKCSRSGTPEQVAEEDRLQKGDTTLCGRPFLLYARVLEDGLWHLTVKCGEHDHPSALDIACHAAARRLTKK
ncbi:hypothetical protein PsorP6_014016 [Peronosclerospora sorghi]|uniref:Uncharacterized protein n=1 Tax=Peronosclerospora sorghi TaxID=230839 RepID=A0ACC0VIB4_9STRA|nr:hypothetical protein PsorP6_014016 [Peronosclerospora sorghi]